jgi:hypothetical protein
VGRLVRSEMSQFVPQRLYDRDEGGRNERNEHAAYSEKESVEWPERPVLARSHGPIGAMNSELFARQGEKDFHADACTGQTSDHHVMKDYSDQSKPEEARVWN